MTPSSSPSATRRDVVFDAAANLVVTDGVNALHESMAIATNVMAVINRIVFVEAAMCLLVQKYEVMGFAVVRFLLQHLFYSRKRAFYGNFTS